MSWAYRASTGATTSSISFPTTLALGAAASAGDRIVCGVTGWGSSATGAPTITDNVNGGGKAYVEDVFSTFTDGAQQVRTSLCSLGGSAAGTPTLSVSFGTSANGGCTAAAYSGLSTANDGTGADVAKAASGAASASPSSTATAVTTAANELEVGYYGDQGWSITVSSSTLTIEIKHDADGTWYEGAIGDKDSGASGSTATATFSLSGNATWGCCCVVYKLAVTGTSQNVSPISDNTVGAWTTNAGATTGLFAPIAETAPIDTDYVQSELNPGTSAYTTNLGSYVDPLNTTGSYALNWRAQKDSASGQQVDGAAALKEGATTIASFSHTNLANGWTQFADALTALQAAAIASSTDLSVTFTATGGTTGSSPQNNLPLDSNAVVSTGWTSPTSAYTNDTTYATAAPAKSTSITSDFWNSAGFGSAIPAGATISQITVVAGYKSSTTGSTGAVIGVQLNDNGTLVGSEATAGMSLTDTTVTQTVSTAFPSIADLNAGLVKARVRGFRSTSNTAVTWSLNYVQITVTYTVGTRRMQVSWVQLAVPGVDKPPSIPVIGPATSAVVVGF